MQHPGTLRTKGAPSGTRTARAGRLTSRPAKTVQWTVFSPRESPRCVAGRQHLTGATRCTIPFGAGSAFARALRFASRGPVAKNAPLERFLNAPADGAPRTALRKRRAVFVCSIPECCEPNGRQHTAGVESYAVSRRGGFIPERFLDAPTEETSITPFHH